MKCRTSKDHLADIRIRVDSCLVSEDRGWNRVASVGRFLYTSSFNIQTSYFQCFVGLVFQNGVFVPDQLSRKTVHLILSDARMRLDFAILLASSIIPSIAMII